MIAAALAETLGAVPARQPAPGTRTEESPEQDADRYNPWSRADRFRVGVG